MFQRNDYTMRQINILSQFLTHVLFREKDQEIEIPKEELMASMVFEEKLKTMIESGEINEAENILFDRIDLFSTEMNLKAALFFYTELLKLPADYLKKCNYTEEEIEEGLEAVRECYGVIDDLTI